MYLALLDAGQHGDIRLVTEKLLDLVRQNVASTSGGRRALDYWANGLVEEDTRKARPKRAGKRRKAPDPARPKAPPKEIADRSYLVICSAVEAFNKWRQLEEGGEVLVCTVIRRIRPLAPGGFRRVAKMEGSSSEAPESVRSLPSRILGI